MEEEVRKVEIHPDTPQGVYLVGRYLGVEVRPWEAEGGKKGEDATVSLLCKDTVYKVKYRKPERAFEVVAGLRELELCEVHATPRLAGNAQKFIAWDGR